MATLTLKNTPAEINKGYAEISKGGMLKSTRGMLKSAVPPCRNRQHIDNKEQQTIKGIREQQTVIGTRAKATTVAFKHPCGRFVQRLHVSLKKEKRNMEEIQDFELIDFIRSYKGRKKHYESRETISMALIGQFYGRISAEDVWDVLGRCRDLGIISFVANGNIRFR